MTTTTRSKPTPSSNAGDKLLTDLSNSKLFAQEHCADLRYVHKNRRWRVWDRKRWCDDDLGDVKRRAKDTVERLYETALRVSDSGERAKQVRFAVMAQRAQRIASMVDLATCEPGIPAMPDQFAPDPFLLNVENGTVDLRTGTLSVDRLKPGPCRQHSGPC